LSDTEPVATGQIPLIASANQRRTSEMVSSPDMVYMCQYACIQQQKSRILFWTYASRSGSRPNYASTYGLRQNYPASASADRRRRDEKSSAYRSTHWQRYGSNAAKV
ncbi:MAG TPA: hypothetical protein VIB38_13040, partial [Aestuariivirgaceae bacterium]